MLRVNRVGDTPGRDTIQLKPSPSVVDTWDVAVPSGNASGTLPLSPPVAPVVGPCATAHEHAFAALYHEHHQSLYRYCMSILRHEQDAQDALQNTMVKAYAAMLGAQPEAQMRPWLFRVAHNECVSLLRRRRQTTELADDLPAAATTEQRHAEREELRQLEQDLSQLPERQRSALVLRELSGLSHDEIAAVLGVTPKIVKSTIFDARSALLQYREGREMGCAIVRAALSDGDKRVLRGRRQRAHLRDCAACRAFEVSMHARPAQLAALAPPLPAAAAAALLHQLLGGAGAGSAGLAGVSAAGMVALSGGGSVSTIASVGAGSAGYGTIAGTSILGGMTAKVAATATVLALAGGTAAVSTVVSSPDRSPAAPAQGGPRPATPAGGGSAPSPASSRAGVAGSAEGVRPVAAEAIAGAAAGARRGSARSAGGASAMHRRDTAAGGSAGRAPGAPAGKSAAANGKAGGANGKSPSSGAKAGGASGKSPTTARGRSSATAGRRNPASTGRPSTPVRSRSAQPSEPGASAPGSASRAPRASGRNAAAGTGATGNARVVPAVPPPPAP